jgi:hypothetical protein
MASLNDFSRALASVPVSQPCTAAAVRALHFRVLAAAQQLFPELSPGLRLVAGAAEFGILREACAQQQLPGACLPVLAWLGDGLSSSSLAPAVSQQAVEVACMLLGAVSLAPGKLEVQLSSGSLPPHVVQETARLLQQLGAFGTWYTQVHHAHISSLLLSSKGPLAQVLVSVYLTTFCCVCTQRSAFGLWQRRVLPHLPVPCVPPVQRMCASSWRRWRQQCWQFLLLCGPVTAAQPAQAAAAAAGPPLHPLPKPGRPLPPAAAGMQPLHHSSWRL